MKFIIIGGGQDGIIFSYLISKLNGAEGEILINKKKCQADINLLK